MKAAILCVFLASFGHFLVDGASILGNANEVTNSTKTDVKPRTLNKAQEFIVRQFRIENIPYLTDNYLRSDNHIVGLLRISQWKIATASKLLKKILRWRASNNMDALGETEPDAGMLEWFPYQIKTVTRNGCPVLEVDAGKWQFADFMESTEYIRDALKMFNVHEAQMVEKTRLAVKKMSPTCDQAVAIIDLKGFEMRHFAEPNALSVTIRSATDVEIYYGNLFESLIFINTPPEFTTVINVLKTYMGQAGKVINVYSEEDILKAMDKIYSYIDPSLWVPK